jgi:hypothetical protein
MAMPQLRHSTRSRARVLTAVAAATSLLVACGGSGSSSDTGAASMKGVVVATGYTPGSTTDPNLSAGYYQGATVCVDANNNGRCDSGESSATTDANGAFTLAGASGAAVIADIRPGAMNTSTKVAVSARTVLRLSSQQAAEQGSAVVISPLSTEVVRLMEANGTEYATEKQNLATRVGASTAQVLGDVNTVAAGTLKTAMVAESNALANRFQYAITKLDRGDKYPDALAVAGGDPTLAGMSVTALTNTASADTRKAITFQQAEQAAFNIEGIPRYDAIFIVMLENKASSSILNSPWAPKINALLRSGNQLSSYYATGNPSEPNYTALGGADDFGITDDSQWNCDATGANAPEDLPVPDSTQPGLASSPFTATCTQTAAVNHNIKNKPNLFNSITAAGMTWRTYSESMNPGQDFRTDSVADTAVTATDNVYAPGTLNGNASAVGNAALTLPLPAGLYKTKHHPGMAYQNVRSAPEFKWSNRTLGGGQWDANLKNGTKYAIPATYDYDQLGTDLASGNVGNLNFVIPDQCDDMHGITVSGTVGGVSTRASDCTSVANNVANATGGAIITRGDNYVSALVAKIENSALWKNPQKRVAIVLMFDEGNATSGFNSCCGWVPATPVVVSTPLKQNADGSWSQDTSINNYAKGNHGHGESIFGILTNQAGAPKGVSDNDAYSHFAFVRTLQDMFGLADPGNDATYMNRAKYTERFIAQNILNLPEYTGSADTHFDAVRPINHAWAAPASYVQKQSADAALAAQTGPDATQVNVWSVK